METLAVTLLLGLALVKIADLVEEIVPDSTRLHGIVTLGLGIAGAFVLDYSLFEGFAVELREAWMGTLITGIALAGTAQLWRAVFARLTHPAAATSERHGMVSRAA